MSDSVHKEEYIQKAMKIANCSRRVAIKNLDMLAELQQETMKHD
jgi:hypothetical protein